MKQSRTPRSHRRQGFTLVEIVAVMPLVGAVGLAATVLLLSVMRFESAVTREVEHSLAWEQVEDLWRDDLRDAEVVSVRGGPVLNLTIKQAHGEVSVWSNADEILHWEHSRNGEVIARERFGLDVAELRCRSENNLLVLECVPVVSHEESHTVPRAATLRRVFTDVGTATIEVVAEEELP